jgi:hypothetical protein
MAEDPELKAMGTVAGALEPLEPEVRARVVRWAAERFEIAVPLAEADRGRGEGEGGDGGDGKTGGSGKVQQTPPLGVFIKNHPVKTQAERVAVLVSWEHLKNGTEEFTPDAIEALWKKSGWKKSGNIHQAIGNAAKEGWLEQKERGKYEVSSYGVKYVQENLVPAETDRG